MKSIDSIYITLKYFWHIHRAPEKLNVNEKFKSTENV